MEVEDCSVPLMTLGEQPVSPHFHHLPLPVFLPPFVLEVSEALTVELIQPA